MKQRMISILTAAAMLLALAGCGAQEPAETTAGAAQAAPNTSYTGTVSAIDEQSIAVATDDGDMVIGLTDATTYSREFGRGGQRPDGMGQMPSDMGQAPEGMDGETPPERPEGEGTDGEGFHDLPGSTGGERPEMPEGEIPEGGFSEMPEGEMQAGGFSELPEGGFGGNGNMRQMRERALNLTLSDIAVGDTVTVQTDDEGKAASVTVSGGAFDFPWGMGQGGPGGMESGVDSYDSATRFTAEASESGTDYASTGTDENALLVSGGAAVKLDNSIISRRSADSTGGDNASFYGVGAAALVTDGTLTIADSIIESDAAGGAGVFAYGDGTAYVADTTIDTKQDTSGGIHVAGGGTLYAWDLTVETDGESSAAIRSDRGSGTMVVDGGSYTSNGEGSPVIYSAADITVHNASLVSTGSEAICIEGLNSIRLFDCDLSGSMKYLSQNDCTWNVILYQSMSGDSQIGNSTFEMVGGSLTAGNGGMFYTTNTESTFLLSGVDITYAEDSEFFLKCTGNANQRGWGTAGSNGADCSFTAIGQAMQGNVIWDSISRLDLYVLEGSTLTGAVINDESNADSGGDGYAALYIGESSAWTVTGDSTLTRLSCTGTIADPDGDPVTVMGTDGTVYVQGSSQFTITVESYSDTVDASGASSLDSWTDFAVTRP